MGEGGQEADLGKRSEGSKVGQTPNLETKPQPQLLVALEATYFPITGHACTSDDAAITYPSS